jgi:DNA-directed RNA polymerase subunit RPC12/RpoP
MGGGPPGPKVTMDRGGLTSGTCMLDNPHVAKTKQLPVGDLVSMILHCQRCRGGWVRRKLETLPVKCPHCGSKGWQTKARKYNRRVSA